MSTNGTKTAAKAATPPLAKTATGEKSPTKTAWAKQGSDKPAVGASRKYSASSSTPRGTTPTTMPTSSPTKHISVKNATHPANAPTSQSSPPKPQSSPEKPKKDRVNPPAEPSVSSTPSDATPITVTPEPTPFSSASPLKSTPKLSKTATNATDVPDFDTPLGLFGPQFQQRQSEDLCFSMGMTVQEVQNLIAIFNDIDLSCSGLINLREFYFLLDTPQNKYTSAILRFGAHKTDPVKLDIDDFVRIVCTFVLMSQTDIYRLCFDTFDEDDSGALSKDEFVVMCDSIQIKGEGFFQGNFRKAMDTFDANHDGLLDFPEFIEMNRKFPLVFWPLFHFQETVQEKTLGKRVWAKIHARQLKIDAWRNYMTRFLGRAPPLTWQEQWCGCISKDHRLRLIAAQLYDQDQLRLKIQQQLPRAGHEKDGKPTQSIPRGTFAKTTLSNTPKHAKTT